MSPDGYTLVAKSLLGNDVPEAPETSKLNDGYMGDSGYEYDYEEPYFEPASEEEALVLQLNTKLAMTEIPREDLE
jgi:hypothetical protein